MLRIFSLSSTAVIRYKFFWQPLTYMFLHSTQGFFHIFFNMWILIMIGNELERYWGKADFLKYYIFCGVGAGLIILGLDFLNYLDAVYLHILPGTRMIGVPTLGASGAIYGLLLAYGLFFPNQQILMFFIIPMRMSLFLIVTGVISLFFIITGGGGNISHIGHLGGLVSGMIFFRWHRKTSHFSAGNRTLDDFFRALSEKLSSYFRRTPGRNPGTYTSSVKFPGRPQATGSEEEEVDRILDKISQKGIHALADEERVFLDSVARKYRKKF
ncbi:MAG TPA: hypothetical protein DC049_20045 [Spirochaetia bacterium]|nr:hypothetical protein [Spirochaetia bacterium]